MSFKCVVNIFLLLMLVLFGVKAHSSTSRATKHKIDEDKLKEIADLRKQLNQAFEKDIDMKNSGGSGVIVQPEWTQDDDTNKGSSKVVVTRKKLQDTAAIRDEIQSAINSNTYVKGEEFSRADHFFGMQFRSKNLLANLIGSDNSNFNYEEVGFGLEEELEAGMPNVVESNVLDEARMETLERLKLSGRRTREVLVLKDIVEDLSFDLGEDVREWKHFEHDGKEYFIGLREIDLLVVEKDNMKYANSQVVHVNAPISYLESYCFWNKETRRQEGMILAAVGENVLWYQARTDKLFWKWSTGMPINGLTYFKIDQEEYLAISSDTSTRTDFSSLNIYQFDIRSQEFWIVQKLQLEDSCSETIFLDTGRDVVLAVVQNNSAAIFVFNSRSETLSNNIKFELKTTIESEGIQSVSAFQMGGLSYLALGGLSPQILQYTHREFVPKTIFGQNFGLVELFLPISARTYRDDLILLVQHRVNFDSHDLVVLETLIWNGEAFEATSAAPCSIGNKTFDFGVGCMLDVQRETGIKGSAVLNRENEVFIIVPRHKAEAGFFQIKTELLSKNSELVDLGEIFAFLKEWVSEQENLVQESYKYLGDSTENMQIDVSSINLASLKTPELEFNGLVGQIFINEYEWTKEDGEEDLEDLIGAIERLDTELSNNVDIIRNRRHLTYETLDFDNIEANEVVLQLLNGEQSYIGNSELIFEGAVTFDSLNILDEIKLSSARFTRDNSIEMDENLKFETINDVKWNDFVVDMIFRNVPVNIEQLQVMGVISEGDIDVHNINELRFPEDYLCSSGALAASIVKGEKYFLKNLAANAVDTGGLVNGLNPFEMITLSEDENIPGLFTFKNLEVSERMEVNGTGQGRGLTDFLSNPTILETNIIHSACNFFHLEVNGPIHVSEKFNGNNLDLVLNDVLYRPSIIGEQIFIKPKKYFNSPRFGASLKLKENFLSGIHLDSFLNKNSQQDVYLNELIGNIYFNTLTVDGLYDSVNISELSRSILRIDEDQLVDGELEIENSIRAQSIEIVESLNGKKNFKTCKDDINVEEVIFENVQANILSSRCDFTGSGFLNGMQFKKSTQNKSSNLYIEEMILANGLQTEFMHYIKADFLLSFLEKIDNIPSIILEGKIVVDKVHVDGDIQVNKIDSHNFDEDIQMLAIWLNRPNFLRTRLEFQEKLIVHDNLKVNGNLNQFDLPYTMNDIANKSESPLLIQSTKEFLTDLIVIGDTAIESVKKLDFTNIATLQTVELFHGSIQINGDLLVDNIEVTGFLNDFPIGRFNKTYRYDTNLNCLVFNAEITFEGHINLENLHIMGKLNSIQSINEFFENIVYKNNICMLKGKTTFKGTTTIEKGAYIKNLNGYNVVHLMRNIVFVNDPDPIVIFAPVLFKEVAQAYDVTVKRFLNVTNLMGCPLRGWLLDALSTNKKADFAGLFYFAPGLLDGNSIYTLSLNRMDMDYVVTLHTPQNLSNHVDFSDVHLGVSINTDGDVNDVNLKQEMQNTLMNSGDQHVTSALTMQSCSVITSLETNTINSNGINLRNLASLQENLKLTSPLSFSKITARNMITSDIISGIDFIKWHQRALLSNEEQSVVITGNWTVKELNVKSHSTSTAGNSSKSSLAQINNEIHDQYNQLYNSFASLCQKSMKLVEDASKKIYFPKYFEKSFSIEENQPIDGVFLVADRYDDYLIVNIECQSKIFMWDTTADGLKLINKFESGLIEDCFAVPDKDDNLHLVAITQGGNGNCSMLGVNTWHFNRTKVSHSQRFDNSGITMVHYPAKDSETFYAIDEKARKVLQLTPILNEKRTWNLPASEKSLYRFLPNDADLGIALTNGQQILLLNQPSRSKFRKRRHSLIGRQIKYDNKPIVKLVGKQLSFSDFRHVLVRILRDLIRRLNIQLTDVNYALSEGELQDEHLQNDFIAILEEIHSQKILPSKSFTDFCFEPNEFSSNLVQILAAKVVQVIWPVLVEVEEVHSHLRSNEHEHPICSDIFKSLSSVVNDILLVASQKNRTDIIDTQNFKKITARMQEFQKKILRIIDGLEEASSDIDEEKTDKPPSSGGAPIHVQLLNTNKTDDNPLDEPFIGQAITGRNLLAADSPHLPARGAGEIVSIRTGMSGNLRTLIAVTESKEHIISGENDLVKILFDVITGSLFQTLSAYKPSCLTSIRSQDESLLAFVEDKHTVRVFIYKGIQGFVEMVKFKVKGDVFGLKFINLGDKRGFNLPIIFLMVSGGNKVEFYEVLMFGDYLLRDKIDCNSWKQK